MGYTFLFIALVANASANILLKLGSSQFAAIRDAGLVHSVFQNFFLLGGVALFALNVLFYALALSRIPLSVGYPTMVVGGVLIITAVSILYLGESITLLQAGGLALIVFGLVLLHL